MSLPGRLVSAAATSRTFILNFWPWLLAAVLLGVAAGSAGSFIVTKALYQREALQCKAQQADFERQLATNAANTERAVGELLLAREREAAARDAQQSALLAALPYAVAKQLQPELQDFRSAINALPELATCLQRPLPVDALRLLERPGGAIPAPAR